MTEERRWCSCNPLREAQEKAAKWDAIVRCGECLWHVEPRFPNKQHGCIRAWVEKKPRRLFQWPILHIEPDGFCKWGERKGE